MKLDSCDAPCAAQAGPFDPLLLVIGRLGQGLGQAVATRVLTAELNPLGAGVVYELAALAALFFNILATPAALFFSRAYNSWRETRRLAQGTLWVVAYIVAVAGFAFAGSALLQRWLGLVSGTTPALVGALVFASVALTGINGLTAGGLNLDFRRLAFVIFSAVPVWLGLAVSFDLVRKSGEGSAWFLGQALGYGPGLVALFLLLRNRGNDRDFPRSATNVRLGLRDFSRFVGSGAAVTSLVWLQFQGVRFALSFRAGTAAVGLFAVAYSIAAAPIVLAEHLAQRLHEPVFYQALELTADPREGRARAWAQYASVYLPTVLLAGTFVAASGPFLARVFLGAPFRVGGTLFAIAALSETIRACNSLLTYACSADVRLGRLLFPVAAGAALVLPGVILSAKAYPLAGPLVAAAAGNAGTLLVFCWGNRVSFPLRWPIRACRRALGLAGPAIFSLALLQTCDPQPSLALSLVTLVAVGVYACWAMFKLELVGTFRLPWVRLSFER